LPRRRQSADTLSRLSFEAASFQAIRIFCGDPEGRHD